MRFGLVADLAFTDHVTPDGHPERPDRMRAIVRNLEGWDRLSEMRRFEPEKGPLAWVEAVHSPDHVRRIRSTGGKSHVQLDPDTHTGPHSAEVALLAAGSVVGLTKRLLEGGVEAGFAAVRPPGHHAESSRAMGFCLYNNVAAAADWAIREQGLERVAVVDFDVHHGNGTQEIFYERGDVLYVSAHQHPLYPGTGLFQEQGRGEGEGATVNFPIPGGHGNAFYGALFDRFLVPILRRYRPQLLLASAGYDAHQADPLAGMRLDEAGFAGLASRLNQAAKDLCRGRVLYVLEGGYNLEALASSVRATIEAALDSREPAPLGDDPRFKAYAEQARSALKRHWEV